MEGLLIVDISSWLGNAGDLTALPTATEQQRASLAWRRVLDKPSSIAFRTAVGTTLAAQTVRLEYSDRSSVVTSDSGAAPKNDLIVFGIKGHASVTATDIRPGYTFNLDKANYRVTDVIETIGERQGVCVKI